MEEGHSRQNQSMDKVLEEGQSPVCLRPCKTAVWNLAGEHQGQSWHRPPWARAGVAGFYSSCGGKSWSYRARVVAVCCNSCPSVLSLFLMWKSLFCVTDETVPSFPMWKTEEAGIPLQQGRATLPIQVFLTEMEELIHGLMVPQGWRWASQPR